MNKKLDVIILAGGKGSRLKKITKKIPKPLIKIGDHPFLYYNLKKFLKISCVNKIFVATGYKGFLIKKYISSSFPSSKKIEIVNSGNVDILQRVKDSIKNSSSDILICYGDTLANINIKKYFDFSIKKNNSLILTSNYKIEFGLLQINSQNFITKYIDGPKLKILINLGYILVKKKDIKILYKFKNWANFIKSFSKSKKIRSYKFNNEFITYNNSGELQIAKAKINKIKNLLKI